MTEIAARWPRRRSGVLALFLLAGCARPPVAPVPAISPPVPSPAPRAVATPAPVFPEVAAPRLDVGIAIERTSIGLPAGDWLLRGGDRVERRRGPLVFSSSGSASAALFVVQTSSFERREPAEAEAKRVGDALLLPAAVVEGAGRFSVRVGTASPRKTAEALLSRVRREAAPDAFLVGAASAPANTAPANTAAPTTAAATASVTVSVDETGARTAWPSPLEVAPVDAGAAVPIGDAQYRGHLVVRATGRGTVHAIDRVNVEDYLKGVVPSEMGPRIYDEVEALKAQTVAARSYALRRKGDFTAEGYDLCATPRCQVYGGIPVEQALTNRAVDETAGEVLVYGGRIADALFTSTCGGRTEKAADVFPSYTSVDVPYLSSVSCSGETPVTVSGRLPRGKREVSLLAVRGAALMASLRRNGEADDVKGARNIVRTRLGLPPRAGGLPLSPPAAYLDVADAAGLDAYLLTEPREREAAPAAWPDRSRAAWALLQRFQIGSGASLPTDRPLSREEDAGLWAGLLSRLGDLEEAEGRIVASGNHTLTVKSAKGRVTWDLPDDAAVFRGGPDVFLPVRSLKVELGDRVRVWVRAGAVCGFAASSAPAAGLYDRESSWIHWTRRFTSSELAAKLRERDPSRGATAVSRIEVLSRGASGRARAVRVTTDRGAFELTGLEIRFSLSIPETLFALVSGKGPKGETVFTFFGRGWGHGVGLCQTGAYGMALAGRTYREILAHYYAGAALGPIPETLLPSLR